MDKGYVDGISITVGSPRKHVWTYAAGLSDDSTTYTIENCPGAKRPGKDPPPFVGSHYYCESANTGRHELLPYYTDDPLWDGHGCLANNNCCSNTDQPWFFRQMAMRTEDYIEARICTDQGYSDEGVLVEQIQLYVQ